MGELRCAAEPAVPTIDVLEQRLRCPAGKLRIDAAARAAGLGACKPFEDLAHGLRHVLGSLAVCPRYCLEDAREAGKPVPVGGWKVRPTVEGLPFRREEDGHRPAAAASE